jgi:hypothetical protein
VCIIISFKIKTLCLIALYFFRHTLKTTRTQFVKYRVLIALIATVYIFSGVSNLLDTRLQNIKSLPNIQLYGSRFWLICICRYLLTKVNLFVIQTEVILLYRKTATIFENKCFVLVHVALQAGICKVVEGWSFLHKHMINFTP